MNNDIQNSLQRELYIDEILDAATSNLTEFGNPFLDDALLGILPNDLCVIGGLPGYGKSQFAAAIAAYNASVKKKNVVFIALEAEPNEVELRLRYAIEAHLYFKDQMRNRALTVNYRKWRLGLLQNDFKKYKEEAISIFIQRYSTLHTVYRSEQYGIKELERNLEEAKDFGDLFCLDHLHYFDIESGKNENSEVGAIMKKIRSLNLFYNKPFIVLAHLRKNEQVMVPSLQDFHGTSDIGKIATVAIMISKDPEGYDAKNQLQKTIISIPKSRTGGLGNLVGCLDYSIQHQGYMPNYSLSKCLRYKDKEKLETLTHEEIPSWAKNAKIKAQDPKR